MKVSSLFSQFPRSILSLLFIPVLAYGLDTELTLQADVDIQAGNNELVTFGLPLALGDVADLSQIRVLHNGVELSVYVESGLRFHWADNSLRSVTIQVDNIDMSGGNQILRITDAGATAPRINERPHSNGWATAGSNKNNLPYPRIFALHDKEYLSEVALLPPYRPSMGSSDAFEQYQLSQFDTWARDLNYSNSTRGNWLFDRSSAMFKAYMTTGRVEFLKEAFLSKQFYFNYVRNDGSPLAAPGGDGCFEYGGGSCADGKYIAPQQAKLAWALVGDNSQWDSSLIDSMALQADIGWNQHGTRDLFDEENEGFTERAAGLVGLAEIIAYEMTGNTTVLAHLNERIASIKDMQQVVKSWDAANGWTPKSGALTHNIEVHEGSESQSSAPSGATNQRGFSPWMTENIVDFLWQTYWITNNDDIPDVLRQIANAIDNYGFTTVYSSGSYVLKSTYAGNHTNGCNRRPVSTDMVYFGSAYADDATLSSDAWWPWYTESHSIETVLTLAAGYYFETDQPTKTRLKSRIDNLISGWSNSACADVSNTMRLWNWQHRSNSVRTWYWVDGPSNGGSSSPADIGTDNGDGSDDDGGDSGDGGENGSENEEPPVENVPPSAPRLLSVTLLNSSGDNEQNNNSDPIIFDNTAAVLVATTACNTGDDPHWQCGGEWKAYSDIEPNDYIAICPGREEEIYSQCSGDDRFILMSNLTVSDGIFICGSNATIGGNRGECSEWRWEFGSSSAELD